jgi:hypothetical protein
MKMPPQRHPSEPIGCCHTYLAASSETRSTKISLRLNKTCYHSSFKLEESSSVKHHHWLSINEQISDVVAFP